MPRPSTTQPRDPTSARSGGVARTRRRPPLSPPIGGGLVRLDTAKVRAQALAALQRAEQSFNAADQLLKEFESLDVQAFERWKYERLGPMLAELARVGQELDEADYHLAMAERESLRTGQPLWQAFQTWQRKDAQRRNRPETPDPEPAAEDRRAFFDALKKAAKGSPLGDLAEALGLDTDPLPFDEDEEADDVPPHAGRPGSRRAKTAVKPDVRGLYRKLCRLLHPDAAGDLSPAQREIWHQVQEAYAARDTARLDTLLARVEHGAGLTKVPRTVSELRALAQHFRRAQAKLRNVLADARRHPAWQFRQRDPASRVRLEREFRRDITDDLRGMAHRLAQIRAALQPRARPRR